MWFEQLMGFREESPQQVRNNIEVEGASLRSLVNGKCYAHGQLETPTLAELRSRSAPHVNKGRSLSVREQVADVQQLHADPANADALFQVASQFNLLEMISPSVTPEQGIGIYQNDRTQGPACAVAAGAGTIYRNYFATVNGQLGQTASNQIDCLADIGLVLGNTDNRLWEMTNGYALANSRGLEEISVRLSSADATERDRIMAWLRVGVQWQTQVTLADCQHSVSQVYCSALPVAYSRQSAELWEPFAQAILDAAYEATLGAGVLNYRKTGNNRVYLTLLGGGAFGNRKPWILDAIQRALTLYEASGLDIVIVSYGRSDPQIRELSRG